MTRPTGFSLTDKNGDAHECVGEVFDTTQNVIILLYPVKIVLGSFRVSLPRSLDYTASIDGPLQSSWRAREESGP
jgi:hypothetical protein